MTNFSVQNIASYEALPNKASPLNILFVLANSYIVIEKEEACHNNLTMLSSTGYEECIGVLAILESENQELLGAALAHITVDNDAPTTIKSMLNELHKIDSSGKIKAVITGGEYGEFAQAVHSGEALYEKVISSLKGYDTIDLAFDENSRYLICVNLINGNIYAWGVFKEDNTYTYETDAFEAVNMAMIPPLAVGNALQQANITKGVSIKIGQEKTGVPALKYDWQNSLTDIRNVLHDKRDVIVSNLDSTKDGIPNISLQY